VKYDNLVVLFVKLQEYISINIITIKGIPLKFRKNYVIIKVVSLMVYKK